MEEKLELADQKVAQLSKLPEVQHELSQVQERHGTAEDRIQRLESQLDEKSTEVAKLQQRLRINEEHNSRLSSTVDKLLQGEIKFTNSFAYLWVYYICSRRVQRSPSSPS